ncbi:MAG: cell wall-binding repeat-containing protein [Herbiconiux sp.]|nr:cell wall-binding repeat-containing protein [Herbiconiux sp.]
MSERAKKLRSGLRGLRTTAVTALTGFALVSGSLLGATAASADPVDTGTSPSPSSLETATTPAPTGAATPAPTPGTAPAPASETPEPAPAPTTEPTPSEVPAETGTTPPDPTAPDPTAPDTEGDDPGLDEAPAPALNAAVVTSFDPENIVSDGNFYDPQAMDATAVQKFLDAQVADCRDGYTCLEDYRTKTTDQPADELCGAYTGRTGETAAQIIANVGAACGVSQKALLTLMQRESQLVNDDFPRQKQYEQAMGFDCSDSGPCNPAFAGFFKQVYFAARQLERYRVHPADYAYRVGVPVKVAYNPGCPGPELTIRTQATASLYDYTPYQPNKGALAGDVNDPCANFGNLNFWVIYTDWFGYPQIDVDRVSGADRYAGAVAIAKRAYPKSAPIVYVANGSTYPDALSAGPAAVEKGGPLLLTDAQSLPKAVADEIDALNPGRIVVVGGVNSVSDAVKSRLQQLAPRVDRIGGASRYETSLLLARDAFGSRVGAAYIATGANFPDALSAGAVAGAKGQPVILVDGSADSLDSGTKAALSAFGLNRATVVGGPNSVGSGIVTSLSSIGVSSTRVAGADRYDTSQKVNAAASTASGRAFLATGQNFPDALAGTAWAGAAGAPLYVVPTNCLPAAVRSTFAPNDVLAVTLLGGPNSLGDGVFRLQAC